LPLDEPLLAENVLCLGQVPLAPYGMPGTPALAKSIEPFIADHKAILLANHGAVTFDETLEQAYWKMESLEQVAHITLLTRLLGQQNFLSKDEVEQLQMQVASRHAKPTQRERLTALYSAVMSAPKFS
jgi:L-fuculose-phosphate aldolase